jgi:hypothetical protein
LLPEERLEEPSEAELQALTLAIEQLTAPELAQRRKGLEAVLAGSFHRRSATVAALLARAVEEPNLGLRKDVVVAIAEAVAGSASSPPRATQWLRHSLGQMRKRQIYGLLQIAATSPGHVGLVHMVLEQCSFSGKTLVQLLQDRSVDIQIRVASARAIEALGYLEAAPTVAILENRIASRVAGQEQMGFAPSLEAEAELLLPALSDLGRALQEAAR